MRFFIKKKPLYTIYNHNSIFESKFEISKIVKGLTEKQFLDALEKALEEDRDCFDLGYTVYKNGKIIMQAKIEKPKLPKMKVERFIDA